MASFTPSSILNSLVLLCLICSLCSGFASKGEETRECEPSSFLGFKGNEKVTYLSLVHKNSPSSLFFQGGKGENRSESDEKTEMLIPSRDKDWTTVDIDGTTGSNYLVKVCLGGQEIKLSFDTGSVLTWTQCDCTHDDSYCYYQVDDSFDRKFQRCPCSDECKSSSGVTTRCSVKKNCREPLCVEGCNQKGECLYTFEYGDNSSTSGVLGRATLNLGNNIDMFLFGCGNKNNGQFSNKENGILGLGYDTKFSIVSQTKSTYHNKFAYCIPLDKHGFLRFGDESNSEETKKESMEVGWKGVYYKLELTSIEVNSQNVACQASVVVDSGTTYTRLPGRLFRSVKRKYGEAMKKKGYEKENNDCLKPDDLKSFDECYKNIDESFEAPVITFKFVSTSVDLPSKGITVRSGSYACLAFLELKDVNFKTVIWGSYQQKGIEINFDVRDRKMWFNKLDDCKPKILGGNNVPL